MIKLSHKVKFITDLREINNDTNYQKHKSSIFSLAQKCKNKLYYLVQY